MKAFLVLILTCIPIVANAQLKSPLGIIPREEWIQLNEEERLDFLAALNGCDDILDFLAAAGEGAAEAVEEKPISVRCIGRFVLNPDGSKTRVSLPRSLDEKGNPAGRGASDECDEETTCKTFLRGDGNGNGSYDTDDDDAELDYLYSSIQDNPAADAYDVDDDGNFDMADYTAIHNYVHHSTGTIAEPNSTTGLGLDPTEDSIDAYCTAPAYGEYWSEIVTGGDIVIKHNGEGPTCPFTYSGDGIQDGDHFSGYYCGLLDMNGGCDCTEEFNQAESFSIEAEQIFYFYGCYAPMAVGLLASTKDGQSALQLELKHKCYLPNSMSACTCDYGGDSSFAVYATDDYWILYLVDEYYYIYGWEIYNWGTYYRLSQTCGSTRYNDGGSWAYAHIDATLLVEELCYWLTNEDVVAVWEVGENQVDLMEAMYSESDHKVFKCYNADPYTLMGNAVWEQK